MFDFFSKKKGRRPKINFKRSTEQPKIKRIAKKLNDKRINILKYALTEKIAMSV